MTWLLLLLGAWLAATVSGAAMVLGSWTERKFVERLPERNFCALVEVLLIVAALSLLVG